MRLLAYGASVAGPLHNELQIRNQDAFALAGCRGGWIAAVADGLGSRKHSDLGARCACQISRRMLRAAPKTIDFSVLLPLLHKQWSNSIAPISPADAASTLLLCRVTEQGQVDVAQLGDGLILIRSNGKFRCVTPERTSFANQTWSLDTTYRQSQWTITSYHLSQPGDGVILMTDGIADDLELTQLACFFNALYFDLMPRSRRNGKRWLCSELNDWATPMHSDDKTLVAIFRTKE